MKLSKRQRHVLQFLAEYGSASFPDRRYGVFPRTLAALFRRGLIEQNMTDGKFTSWKLTAYGRQCLARGRILLSRRTP